METLRFKVIVIVLLVFALIAILRFVQRKELQLKYSLVWIAVDIMMIVAVSIPNFLKGLASLMGIYSIANMLFFLGIIFTLAICFSLTVALSRASERIRSITQEIAIKENDVEETIKINKEF